MAVTIRLRREGTKNSPYYRIVAADRRSPRDGKFLELLGTYDPKKVSDNSTMKLDRVEHWVKNGAQPSETVRSLIKKAKARAATAPIVTEETSEPVPAPAKQAATAPTTVKVPKPTVTEPATEPEAPKAPATSAVPAVTEPPTEAVEPVKPTDETETV